MNPVVNFPDILAPHPSSTRGAKPSSTAGSPMSMTHETTSFGKLISASRRPPMARRDRALGAGNVVLGIPVAGIDQQGLPSMQRRWASRILVLRVTLASEAAAFDGLRVDRHSLAPRPASKAIIAPPHVISCQGAGLLPLLRASIAFRCRLSETLRHMGEFFAANEGFTRWSRMKAIGSLPIARSTALSMFEECNPWLNWWSSGSTTRLMRIAS